MGPPNLGTGTRQFGALPSWGLRFGQCPFPGTLRRARVPPDCRGSPSEQHLPLAPHQLQGKSSPNPSSQGTPGVPAGLTEPWHRLAQRGCPGQHRMGHPQHSPALAAALSAAAEAAPGKTPPGKTPPGKRPAAPAGRRTTGVSVPKKQPARRCPALHASHGGRRGW